MTPEPTTHGKPRNSVSEATTTTILTIGGTLVFSLVFGLALRILI